LIPFPPSSTADLTAGFRRKIPIICDGCDVRENFLTSVTHQRSQRALALVASCRRGWHAKSERGFFLKQIGTERGLSLGRGEFLWDSLVRSLRHLIHIPWALWKSWLWGLGVPENTQHVVVDGRPPKIPESTCPLGCECFCSEPSPPQSTRDQPIWSECVDAWDPAVVRGLIRSRPSFHESKIPSHGV
jgi:hypothetical protein